MVICVPNVLRNLLKIILNHNNQRHLRSIPKTNTMKKHLLPTLFATLTITYGYSQIGVNATGAVATTSSMFEVLQASGTNNSMGIYVSHSGTPTTGFALQAIKSGAGVNNIAAYLSATGGTNNIALRLAGSTSGTLDLTPAATTTSYALTFPSAQGAASSLLMNDGAGGLSWTTLGSLGGAALTKTDDANVTLTLGGSPTTSLVNAASLTLGWTGQLSIARGGTASGTALAGSSIMISDGTKIVQGAAGTATTLLHGNAAGAPTYSAVSLTADVNNTLPVGNGGTGTATAFTQGSVVFAGTSGVYAQNNSNLFWDNSNASLGIGTTTPSSVLHTIASGAKTAAYSGNTFTNTATSSTNSIIKAGTEIKSTGTWNGTSSSNIGLYVSSVTGGTKNYDAIFNGGGSVGIGTATPDASALLDVTSTTKGILIPRVTLTGGSDATTITNGNVTGLLVYNTGGALGAGYYYWNGSGSWLQLISSATTGWVTSLNSVVPDALGNGIGTSDASILNFRQNGKRAGRVDNASKNTFLGYEAGSGAGNAADSRNTAIGDSALFTITTGVRNTAVGANAGKLLPTAGADVTAVGFDALKNNTSDKNSAVGSYALSTNTSGTENTAIGYQSLLKNLDDQFNTAVGYQALLNAEGAFGNNGYNTAVGDQSLYSQTSGYANTAVGYKAGFYITNGRDNVAMGQNALLGQNNNGGPLENTAIGKEASYRVTGGGRQNVSVGAMAMYNSYDDSRNVAIGWKALYNCQVNNSGTTVSTDNVGVGYGSLFNVTPNIAATQGVKNIALGFQAADNITTGTTNIIIGYDIDAPSPTTNGQLSIGNLIYGTGINGTATTVSTGNVGIKTNAPNSAFEVNGAFAATLTTTSTGAAAITLDNSATVWLFNGTFTGNINLPVAATGNANRIYTIVNASGGTRNISSYNDLTGTAQTTLANGNSLMIISTGATGTWQQIK